MAMKCRFSEESDAPRLVEFWRKHGGWDDIDLPEWKRRFDETPFGRNFTIMVEDSKSRELLAQGILLRSRVMTADGPITAVRPFAPIVAEKSTGGMLGKRFLSHPTMRMLWFALRELKSIGTDVFYMVPDPRWIPVLSRLPGFEIASFPLFSLQLPLAWEFELPPGVSAAPIESFGEEVDALWNECATRLDLYRVGVVRNARLLAWKVGNGDYEVTAVRRAGELIGLAASRAKGDRQWLICDMLVRDTGDSLDSTLRAVANLAHRHSQSADPDSVRKVAILASPAIEPRLRQLGFERDSYDFHLMVSRVNSRIDAERVAPGKWYISANE